MIKHENAVREIAFGRHTQKLETQFVLRTLPDWLTTPVAAESQTWVNNGLTLNDGSTELTPKLVTAYFDVEQMTQVSLELFNANFGVSSNEAHIVLMNADGQHLIQLASANDTTWVSYHSGGLNSSPDGIYDEDVGLVSSIRKFRFLKDNQGVDRYSNVPRNIRLAIFPVEREITILENGVTAYTLNRNIHPAGIDVNTIDFSGRWRFEVYCANYLRLSGAELKIQQNL